MLNYIHIDLFPQQLCRKKKCKQIISVNLPKQSLVTTKLSAHVCCNFPGSRGSKTLQTSSMSQMLIRFLQFPPLQESITMNLNTIFFLFVQMWKWKICFTSWHINSGRLRHSWGDWREASTETSCHAACSLFEASLTGHSAHLTFLCKPENLNQVIFNLEMN